MVSRGFMCDIVDGGYGSLCGGRVAIESANLMRAQSICSTRRLEPLEGLW